MKVQDVKMQYKIARRENTVHCDEKYLHMCYLRNIFAHVSKLFLNKIYYDYNHSRLLLILLIMFIR